MWTESEAFPDIVVIKAGIIDDGGLAKYSPGSETFTSRKPEWMKTVDGAMQFEESFQIKPSN
jgi:hypothetical protein